MSEVASQPLEPLSPASDEHKPGAGRGEHPGEPRAEPGARPREDHDFAIEPEPCEWIEIFANQGRPAQAQAAGERR